MDAAITVVNMHTYRPNAHARYIGRGSPFGNPFVVGTDGDRDACVAKFAAEARLALAGEPNALHPDFAAELANLRTRHLAGEPLALACFCAPLACHGDAIKALLAEPEPAPTTTDAAPPAADPPPPAAGDRPVCVVASPRRGRTAFRDLDEAFAAIAKAKGRGGYLLVGIVGSREREGEREGRLVEEAVAGLCAYHEIPLDKVCVVSGGAQGLDRIARRFAEIHQLPYIEFPALWAEHGKRAGYVRNDHLVAVCDELIAGPGNGGGTPDAMQRAREKKIPVTTI